MRWKLLFDNDTKLAVISSHGHYRLYRAELDGDHYKFREQIQEGSTDELGLIYNFVGDDVIDDPDEITRDLLIERIFRVCGKTVEERQEIMEHERANFLITSCGIEFTGRWTTLGLFEG